MKFIKASTFAVLTGALATMGLAGAADAQFYKGKRVNVIINYAAGGNTDIQGRSVLRHMEQYVPGKPRFLVRNISGAGGIVGVNFLGEVAKRDGYTIGIFTIPIMAQIMQAPELRVDLRKLQMVGAIAQQTISHIRKDVIPGGMKTWQDFTKITKTIKTAGHGPQSSKDLRLRMFMEALQIPYEHVTGYKSAGKIRTAILKNEIQLTADSMTGYFARVVPNLIKPGISMPLWHIGLPTPDGKDLRCHPALKQFPCFIQAYEYKFGKGARPKGMPFKAMVVIAGTRELLRIIVLPEGAPKAALDTMRAAWVKTMKDEAYLAEFRKQNGSELDGSTGEEAQTTLNRVATVDPAVQKWLLAYAEKGKK